MATVKTVLENIVEWTNEAVTRAETRNMSDDYTDFQAIMCEAKRGLDLLNLNAPPNGPEQSIMLERDGHNRLLCPVCGEPLQASLIKQYSGLPIYWTDKQDKKHSGQWGHLFVNFLYSHATRKASTLTWLYCSCGWKVSPQKVEVLSHEEGKGKGTYPCPYCEGVMERTDLFYDEEGYSIAEYTCPNCAGVVEVRNIPPAE